jgi:hypothetical protein
MGPTDLLRVVGSVLDSIGCQRFTTGSVASMIYGEPRFTNDIDVVVRMDERQAREFAASFDGGEWYVSPDAAVAAVRGRGMFNLIHVPSGLKVDLIVSPETAHDLARFARVRRITMPEGRQEPVAAPEDVILKKLQFFREGGSSKHLRDIVSVIQTQRFDGIDWQYLADWSERLGVSAEFERIRREADPGPHGPPSA